MSIRLLAAAALLCAMPAAAAEEGAIAVEAPASSRPPDWSVTVGGGALVIPSYPGAATTRWMPAPFVDIRYRDRFFLNPFAGFGVNAIATQRLVMGAAVLPDFGRSESSADRLRGWGSVGAGANMKVFGTYSLGPVALLADVRRQLGAGNGTLVDAGLTKTLFLSRHLMLIPTLSMTWADARYMRAYFGIDGNQSATSLAQGRAVPIYAARAGLRDAALTLYAIVPLDDRWSMQSLVRGEVLLGDASASPLTEQRVQPTVGGFLAYRL
jgi:outer membrane scaffolding protein for murein synthesis (MipA/OmpV family)